MIKLSSVLKCGGCGKIIQPEEPAFFVLSGEINGCPSYAPVCCDDCSIKFKEKKLSEIVERVESEVSLAQKIAKSEPIPRDKF